MNIELYDKIKNLYLKYHKEKTWNHVESVAKEAKKACNSISSKY